MVAPNATIQTQRGCASTYILHVTRCMLRKEKSIETMEKSIVNMENLMKTMENRWALWGNQWTPWKNRIKPWKNRWAVQMASFSSKIQQSTGFSYKIKCSKLQGKVPQTEKKKTKTKTIPPKKLHPNVEPSRKIPWNNSWQLIHF